MTIELSTSSPISFSKHHADTQISNNFAKNHNNNNLENTNSLKTNSAKNESQILEETNETADKKVISELAKRDREVRAHEQAHKAAAGRFSTGGPSFKFEKGPNGKFFAVSGHVNIDVSEESTPEKTIQKMRIVKKAALAPAKPSTQDRAVAAKAAAKESEARKELMQEKSEKANEIGLSNSNSSKSPNSLNINKTEGSNNFTNKFRLEQPKGNIINEFI